MYLVGSARRAEGLTEFDVDNLNAILKHEIADNTLKNYVIQWNIFRRWAGGKGVSSLPAESAQVAAYLAERIEQRGHKPATLRVAAAAIAFAHRVAGFDDPCAGDEVKRTLRGATRKAGRSQKQAEALTAEALGFICCTARRPRPGRGGRLESPQTAETRGNHDIALMSLMRDAMLRVSEAAALTWAEIQAVADGTGRLLIRRSKTDPEGRGAVAFVSAPTMAALALIRDSRAESDSGTESGSVFRLAAQPDVKANQDGSTGGGARRRLQRALPARGHGTRPRESRHRTSRPDERRTLAHARDAGALCP